jgi:hypothetical protein
MGRPDEVSFNPFASNLRQKSDRTAAAGLTMQLRAHTAGGSHMAERDDIRPAPSGHAIAALRVMLIANAFLEAEVERLKAEVSSGFSRGRVKKAPPRKGSFQQEL